MSITPTPAAKPPASPPNQLLPPREQQAEERLLLTGVLSDPEQLRAKQAAENAVEGRVGGGRGQTRTT